MLQQQIEPALANVDSAFIATILQPYAAKECIYLKSASVTPVGPASIYATFSIPNSCYIDSTGHFNAVELNICTNQMLYTLVGDRVRRATMPHMEDWSLDRFLDRQLPSMLITRLQSRFRRPIDAASFSGEFHIQRITAEKRRPLFLQTNGTFRDANGGVAEAEVEIAILSA